MLCIYINHLVINFLVEWAILLARRPARGDVRRVVDPRLGAGRGGPLPATNLLTMHWQLTFINNLLQVLTIYCITI